MRLEAAIALIIGGVLILTAGIYLSEKSKAPPLLETLAISTTTSLSTPEKVQLLTSAEKAKKYPLAPEISTPDGFINTPSTSSGQAGPITIGEFRGKKVVLLDIWTYSCINCQRTLPYLRAWYEKYKDQGLEIIGLHTPEFAFEHLLPNVEVAVKKFGLEYPVVLDNDFSTWNALGNQYWPRKYLIDIDGYIVYDHAGEGNYAETEAAIVKALEERRIRLGLPETIKADITKPADIVVVDAKELGSPEVYFGSSRNQFLANGTRGISGIQNLTLPPDYVLNELNLGGRWNFAPEYAENLGGALIGFKYKAKNVYFVASSASGTDVDIYQDGKLLKTLRIQAETLYTLIENPSYGEHLLEIKVKDAGLRAFTFTFG